MHWIRPLPFENNHMKPLPHPQSAAAEEAPPNKWQPTIIPMNSQRRYHQIIRCRAVTTAADEEASAVKENTTKTLSTCAANWNCCRCPIMADGCRC